MPPKLSGLSYINKLCLLIPIIAIIFSSCFQKKQKINTAVKKELQDVDSLAIVGNGDGSAERLIKKVGPEIDRSNLLITTYYCLQSKYFALDSTSRNLYADSALAYFSIGNRAKEYPDEYYQALLSKGDACLKNAKYLLALNYFYQAKKLLPLSECDNGDLASKMGVIYFRQRNFRLAGKYWALSYNLLNSCDQKLTAQKEFFMKQGTLDNAGFSYQKAGMLDSAKYYYNLDVELINKTDSSKLVEKHYINASRSVVDDNLGGLSLKNGDFTTAKDYLLKSIALGDTSDGSLISTYTKLAELYMKTGENNKAEDAFKQSRLLLNRFYNQTPEYNINWNLLYSQYLFKLQKTADAYRYQAIYIRLRDSLSNNLTNLYRLDVARELDSIQQSHTLSELSQKNKTKKIYLIGIVIIVILFIVILVLISRNLNKAKRSHKDATTNNQQMQLTLFELERVNKNYIRIMRVMAHDLRNPISGMTGIAAMLIEEDEFSEENKNMLRLIESTGIHTMEMINELLKSGLSDENEKLVKQKVDIKALLFDSVELLQFKANDKNQQIIFEADDSPIIAEVSHEKIWRVMNNLVVNAIKFSHTDSKIVVNVAHDDKHILMSVADNGIGIPENQKEAVFEMFTSAKRVGTSGEQPFGLGLSISKRIVEMHGGKIWFENNTGSGTIFYIQLPYAA